MNQGVICSGALCVGWYNLPAEVMSVTATQSHATDGVARTSKDNGSDVRANSRVMYKLSEFSVVCLFWQKTTIFKSGL